MERRNKKTKSVGNGEGSLYYSEALGRWIYQYYIEGDSNRKTMTQKKNESVKEFKARVTELKNKLNNGTYIGKSKDTFIQILEKHIEQKYKDNLTGDSSYERDLYTLKQIEKTCKNFINKPIQKITADDIEEAKDEIRKYSNNSINKIWRFLYKTFSIAVSRRKIIFNPMDDESLNKPISNNTTKEIEALTIEEERKINEYLNNISNKEQYKLIALLQLNTGMRIGEILALSLDCIDLEKNTITVYRTLTKKKGIYVLGKHTKTYNRKTNIDKGKRTFPMTPKAKEIIKEVLQSNITNINKLLFWDYNKNSLILPKRVNDFLNSLNKENSIQNFTTHKLRHTFITRCQEKGIPLVVIQAMVGHIEGSTVTNDTYTSVSLEFMNEQIKKII